MEAHSKLSSKSFHLQTPFAHGGSSFSSESSVLKVKQKRGSTLVSRSVTNTTEGTFDEVIEYNKHLLALKDLEELKNQYYDEYLENLERKVLKQRRELAKKEGQREKSQSDEDSKKEIPLPKSRKLPHHKLKHDNEYMRKVTKSRFYHLLAARDLMRRKGLLKSQSDEDLFWNRVLHDNDIWNHPVPNNLPPETVTRVMFNRFTSVSRLRRITENGERQRVTFSESPSKSFANSTEGAETCSDLSRDIKLRKLQVKMKLPKLHSLKETSPLPPIQPKIPTITESARKLKQLEKFKSIQHAYDVAMVNHAVTKKMLKRHGFSTEKESKFLLDDIVASTNLPKCILPHSKDQDKLSSSQGQETQVFITEPVYGNDQVLIPDLEYKYPHGNRSAHKTAQAKALPVTQPEDISGSTEEKTDYGKQVTSGERDISLPLSYTMMLAQSGLKVKEAKSSQSMWLNYTVADDDS